MESEMRLPSPASFVTLTVTSWPTARTSFGCATRRREISVTWTRPSTPPRATNAPNSVRRPRRGLGVLEAAELVRLPHVGREPRRLVTAEVDLRDRAEGTEAVGASDHHLEAALVPRHDLPRSEEHTSELQSL